MKKIPKEESFITTIKENKPFLLYRGVIEDNNSTEKNGKVRVRIFGIHTENNENSGEDFEFVKTSELPWAEVLGGTGFGLISGIGLTSILRQGTWVWVILENNDPNKPIIIGTIQGKNSVTSVGKYSGGEGFCDPNEEYPIPDRSTEVDINRLARGVTSGTIHDSINASLDTVNETDSESGANVSQDEPSSTNDSSSYPNVNVIETHSGHVIELDDSAGNERIRLFHRTGSYIEIKPDGSIVQKSVGQSNHYIHTADVNEHIAGAVKKYIESNIDEIIGGNFLQNIKGNLTINVEGNLKWVVGGTTTLESSGNYSATAPRIDLN